jgi:hypothetical protein
MRFAYWDDFGRSEPHGHDGDGRAVHGTVASRLRRSDQSFPPESRRLRPHWPLAAHAQVGNNADRCSLLMTQSQAAPVGVVGWGAWLGAALSGRLTRFLRARNRSGPSVASRVSSVTVAGAFALRVSLEDDGREKVSARPVRARPGDPSKRTPPTYCHRREDRGRPAISAQLSQVLS